MDKKSNVDPTSLCTVPTGIETKSDATLIFRPPRVGLEFSVDGTNGAMRFELSGNNTLAFVLWALGITYTKDSINEGTRVKFPCESDIEYRYTNKDDIPDEDVVIHFDSTSDTILYRLSIKDTGGIYYPFACVKIHLPYSDFCKQTYSIDVFILCPQTAQMVNHIIQLNECYGDQITNVIYQNPNNVASNFFRAEFCEDTKFEQVYPYDHIPVAWLT